MNTIPESLLSEFAPLLPVGSTGIIAHQAPDFFALWEAIEHHSGHPCSVPFWAAVWPGARLLSDYIFQKPELVSGKSVLDFGAGGAVAAIAAVRAGALEATANDIDPIACQIAAANATANGTPLTVDSRDLLNAGNTPDFGVIILSDMFYQKSLNARLHNFLMNQRTRGTQVIIADGNRPFTPRKGIEVLTTGRLPVDKTIEGCDARDVTIFRMVD
ncbi:MAG: 50S ribosomal protein L11 methyltransferase [Chitinispirillaceae bacterium]|nr:50S ribosomal protein L11 methyltransferase [Chitinispirillaceae bacterium]